MATLSSLVAQALDTVAKRDFSPSSPADTTNVFLAALAGSSSATSGVGLTVTSKRAAGTQTAGSIAAGNTAQNAVAANASRVALVFINTSSGPLYVNINTTATTANGIPVLPGGSVNFAASGFVPTGALSVIGAITAQTFITIEA